MFRTTKSATLRSLIAAAAIATSSLFLALSAGPAMANSPAYRLAPVAALSAADTIVVRDVLWRCTDAGCTAKAATSRPAIVCATAAKKIGKVASFEANGRAFSDAELAECNKKAK